MIVQLFSVGSYWVRFWAVRSSGLANVQLKDLLGLRFNICKKNVVGVWLMFG